LLTTIINMTPPSLAQTAAVDPAEKPDAAPAQTREWSFTFTPYAWLTAMSGSQTVKGRTVTVDTNVLQLFDKSQSLIPFMGYFEARRQDGLSLCVDLMYANLTAVDPATRNHDIQPGVGVNVMAQ